MDSPVIVSLEELIKGVDDTKLHEAFGPNSLGIIVVKELPQYFHELRLKVLKSISLVANQDQQELEKLENEESTWLTGWSRGKEKLASTGLPDFNKGSYYINCAFHNQDDLDGPYKEICDQFPDFKTYTNPNIWPDAKKKGLEDFKPNVKQLCNLIIDIGAKVAYNCDKYIYNTVKDYDPNFLQRIVNTSTCTKARLLHYFPSQQTISNNDDDWCGEHVDHSCITGLTSALFIDESKGITNALDKNPDPDAGLYIRNRQNKVVKVNIPPDCVAFQTGSCLEEISKHNFKAVPHYVRGTSLPNISRNTLAVFCQPDLNEMVNDQENFAQFTSRILSENH